MMDDFTASAMANGNILPSTAIKLDTTTDFRVIQATAGLTTEGDICIGISQKGQWLPPPLADGNAAIAGNPVLYYINGAKDVAALLAGSVTRGDRLKSTAGGGLIKANAADNMVAIAKQSGVSGDYIDVDVIIGVAPTA
jgi:hypothetical protein